MAKRAEFALTAFKSARPIPGCAVHRGIGLRDILSVLVAIGVTGGLLYGLRPFAHRIGLLDSPGARKTHSGNVPMIGGLAMFVGFTISVLTLDIALTPLRPFFAASAVLVVVGVLDDLHELSSRVRFATQILAAGLMVGWGQVELVDLGALHSNAELFTLGAWSAPFSVFCAVGVINALNMIDGVDGLAGGVALVALSALAWLAHAGGQNEQRDVLLLLSACVLCFVLVNARMPWRGRAAVFMGDAGSMFLGFAITWFFIDLSQAPARAMPPVAALWLLLIPLFDTVWLLFKRPLSGRWPTVASHDHLHHVMQMAGLGAGATTVALWSVAALAAGVGIAGTLMDVSEAALFYGFLCLFVAYALVMSVVWRQRKSTFAEHERRHQMSDRRSISSRRKTDRRLATERRGDDDRRDL